MTSKAVRLTLAGGEPWKMVIHVLSLTSKLRRDSIRFAARLNLNSGSKAAIYLDFDPLRSIRVEMDILFTGLPNFYVDFLQASHVSDTESLRLFNADFYNSRQIDAWNFQTSSYEYVGKPILENIWYHITFEGITSTPNGHVRVMVNNDETSAAELLDIDTTDKPITQISLGITLLNNSVEAHTLYIDNVEISEP